MNLIAKAEFNFDADPFVGLLERQPETDLFRVRNLASDSPKYVTLGVVDPKADVSLSRELDYVVEGDMLRFNPSARVARVLYRRTSHHNFLLLTERCNSRCLMCSQPPRDIDDGYLVDDILRMIPWMGRDTPELGITGGEPTLLHDRLIELLGSMKRHLPRTAIHMLTNGRLLSYHRYARRVADVEHPDLMLGIPLYADTAAAHDFVVQAKGAFNQTIFGILNLGRVGVRIEIRMVIHRETYLRLPQFARFVVRNLPFVSQVVLMGLELTGFARSNLSALWIDPIDYQDHLEEAVLILNDAGITVSIYNHQLCLLRPSLHSFARKSISDWKNIYMPECEPCGRKEECGGFFASAALRYSRQITPFLANPALS